VCSLSSSGCTSDFGLQTSINTYKLYPPSSADVYYGFNIAETISDGYFFTKGTKGAAQPGATTLTTNPAYYWLRSPHYDYVAYAMVVKSANGDWDGGIYGPSGFRPAGVLNLEGAQCLLAANISLRKLFRLENADK
jgi:hypothetical protein